ncbi:MULTISPECIES: NADPH-dependent F420 reductase [Nocardiopsis]|jgi:NADPH-dependent F420 reductase|uniref:NADPH-dependent F420 reductase n=2 Tax=Nocardiopsis alba TaxID=53437 RepID=A0A7K2IMU1_9ACTN|nr:MULTISPECIES: NADPH-dependent F420 reductase [Nocardiopsis]AFR10696.1 NADPH-dependent F420 reductase [Nocardiopsis alba ATCC BAA-2165]MEC3895541.1 NADPH-dependent F420 reductase [Nocardiopsis sp. LDBS1602]MYR31298.1 NADPH-dependent F420 reductase [Nocardiopsis alba]
MTEQSTPQDVDITGKSIAVLGGTGDQGRGLARRFALAGHTVHLGSRSAERAAKAANDLVEAEATEIRVHGLENAEAAAMGDIVVVAVPWDGHRELLVSLADRLAGKIVVDCVNPLGFDKKGPYALDVPEGSAAQQAAEVLPGSRVTAAFHHVSAVLLLDPEVAEIELDILVLGEDREATDVVRALAGTIPGARGVFGGRLRNAHQVEALTANLIAVNRRYKTHAGIRVTGL